MITIIQILLIIFALFALSRVITQFRKNKITLTEFIIWDIIWLVVIVVALMPAITSFFANIVGIKRGVDFLIYIGMTLLFYLVFRIYVKIENMEQNITKIVREAAIKGAKKKK